MYTLHVFCVLTSNYVHVLHDNVRLLAIVQVRFCILARGRGYCIISNLRNSVSGPMVVRELCEVIERKKKFSARVHVLVVCYVHVV